MPKNKEIQGIFVFSGIDLSLFQCGGSGMFILDPGS
jgi:hypothetical protein